MNGDSLELLKTRGRAALSRLGPLADPTASGADAEADEGECAAFGYLRGLRERALCVEFRLANGNSLAFPYSWLGPVTYNPSAGLLLKFTGDLVYLVLLEGSNLNAVVRGDVSLYDRGLQRHRITWVREMTRQQAQQAGEGEVTVERIRTLSYRPDDEPQGIVWMAPFQEPT